MYFHLVKALPGDDHPEWPHVDRSISRPAIAVSAVAGPRFGAIVYNENVGIIRSAFRAIVLPDKRAATHLQGADNATSIRHSGAVLDRHGGKAQEQAQKAPGPDRIAP